MNISKKFFDEEEKIIDRLYTDKDTHKPVLYDNPGYFRSIYKNGEISTEIHGTPTAIVYCLNFMLAQFIHDNCNYDPKERDEMAKEVIRFFLKGGNDELHQ